MALDPALQELVDRAAIRDLMMNYARGIDRGDLDLVASLFTPDAYANYFGDERDGRDNIITRLRGASSRYDGRTHFMGDQEIRITGDTADVETYAVDCNRYTVEGSQYLTMGGLRYQDKLVRQDGRWLIQHRVLHVDWRQNMMMDTSVPRADRVPIP